MTATEREVVLVTGTRTGIGEHLARHFLARGALVEGCSRKPAWEAEGYTHHLVDVADEEAVKAMLATIRKRHGRLDVLVNNAGIAAMNHTLLTPVSTVDQVMATNFRGVFLCSREAAKIMMRSRYGRIVNLTTVAVPLRLAGEAVYAASKAAVATFTQVLAYELGEYGITCNAVGPSPIATDLIRNVPKQKIDELVNAMAIKRLGTLEDVANVVDFFVRRESGAVTGQVIYLGGV